MNFANVTDWVIPQGNVTKVVDSQNRIIWQKNSIDYTEPFYVENITNSTETLSIKKMRSNYAPTLTIEYSLDKSTWSTLGTTSYNTSLTYSLKPGDKLYLRCLTNSMSDWSGNDYNNIIGVSKVGGNIMSLLYGSNFRGNEESFPTSDRSQFIKIFEYNTNLRSAADLILPVKNLTQACYASMFAECFSLTEVPKLPSTNLASACYQGMFGLCSSLVNAPVLPATTLAYLCYDGMFSRCTSLVTAPVLPATTLANECYNYMFDNCSSLVNAPSLPATTLADRCYYSMFSNCTSLVNAPELPALNLTTECYWQMFYGCVSLNNIKCLATNGTIVNTPASSSDPTYQWTRDVAANGTFYKAAGINWHSGVSGIPSGWTVIEV